MTIESKLLRALAGERFSVPPVWFMRQAGRHLPEYLEVRARAKDFLDFCYSPSLASEATLQPIRRYGMDGAILFADILLILDALGRGVRFEAGEGPIVEAIDNATDLARVSPSVAAERLSPVYETVARVRKDLPSETALIGFAGAPWTVAVYAIEGRGKTDKSESRLWAQARPGDLANVLDVLVEATALYLKAQADAGAQALMLFDSWAEGLPDNVFHEIIIRPTAKLVARLRSLDVDLPIIGFPRGAGVMVPDYVRETGVSAVGLDTAASPVFINNALEPNFPVQGHLDPLLLLAGGNRLTERVKQIASGYASRPHIFNLGHGVLPQTPIAHVELALEALRKGGGA